MLVLDICRRVFGKFGVKNYANCITGGGKELELIPLTLYKLKPKFKVAKLIVITRTAFFIFNYLFYYVLYRDVTIIAEFCYK